MCKLSGLLLTAVLAGMFTSSCEAFMIKSKTGKFDISTNRVAHLTGPIEKGSFKTFEKEMIETIRKGDRVVLIDSGGGLVDEGQLMINLLNTERKEGTRIVCVVVKAAHSMAFNLLTRCDVRLAKKQAFFLVHKIERQVVGQAYDGRLTALRLRAIAKSLEIMDEPYRQANSAAMRLSLNEYDMLADNETIWTVDNLIKRGYLDDVVEIIP